VSIGSFVLAQLFKLPPKQNEVRRKRTAVLPMDDGVTLMTDLYHPKLPGQHPTILMRLPYGRKGFSAVAEIYAERGFNVVLQACRGTEASGGDFDPLINERDDGLATLRWLEAQPWFDGRLGLSGPSYLGYAQWAICDALPPHSAMATKVTSSEFQSVVFPSGAFHLGLWLSWMQVIEGLRGNPLKMSGMMFSGRVEKLTARAAMSLPLIEADTIVAGRKVGFWRHWFENAIGNDAFWERMNHRHRLGPETPPNHFISGWYDFMIDQLLRDYRTLVDAGQTPYLTIGPWTHISNDLHAASISETLTWMRAQLMGDTTGLRAAPVRFHVGGSDTWHECETYPPPTTPRQFFLAPEGRLLDQPDTTVGHDDYRYDPADPTPNIGGAMFAFTGAGPVDNASRESRPDVLCYTSAPLETALTIVGQVQARLFARTSIPHVDFFVRLCDVSPKGVSTNLTDGLVRLGDDGQAGSDGFREVAVSLHATAHRLLPGHRLRLQVSSGAHPRFARNLGTDEPVGTATTLRANDIEIFHGAGRESGMTLPLFALPA
jgi:putative CocE/NonD family hydrolase